MRSPAADRAPESRLRRAILCDLGCETRSVRCEDQSEEGRARAAGCAGPHVGPRNRWDPSKMSLEAHVIHVPPPPLVVMTL